MRMHMLIWCDNSCLSCWHSRGPPCAQFPVTLLCISSHICVHVGSVQAGKAELLRPALQSDLDTCAAAGIELCVYTYM